MRNTIKTRTTHNEVEKSKFSPEKPLKRAKFVPKRKQQRKIAVIIASFVGKKIAIILRSIRQLKEAVINGWGN
jgi:hypothetical protein